MIGTVYPGSRSGTVSIPSSKSLAHRQLISGALSAKENTLVCREIADDLRATIFCLRALGADIQETESGKLKIDPFSPLKGECGDCISLFCGESGSTLRFLLPVAGALGRDAVFHMEGRLPQRPLTELEEELVRHGMACSREGNLLRCRGKLRAGTFCLPGNVSSQYISGLLLALPLLDGDSRICISGTVESAGYLALTESVLEEAGIRFQKDGEGYFVPGGQRYVVPEIRETEGDWSAAGAFFCLGAASQKGISVTGLSADSLQGDRAILDLLRQFGADVTVETARITVRKKSLQGRRVDASSVPDLIPAVCALASCAEGVTEIVHAGRLRFKESDRISSTVQMLRGLGAVIRERESGMMIQGIPNLDGGEAETFGDHRIAMAAAVAACFCRRPVQVKQAECVEKSYLDFWRDLEALEVEK